MAWYAWCLWAFGTAGLLLHWTYPVFPSADLDFSLSRGEIEARADAILARFGAARGDRSRTVLFRCETRVSYFVQKELGRERFNGLARAGRLPLWFWKVRYFRPFDPVEHEVGLAPDGSLVSFSVGRSDFAYDTAPEAEEAERRCRAFLAAAGFAPGWRIVETKAEKLPARLDRYFIFEAPDRDLGSCRRRAYVKLAGERIVEFRHFLRAPDEADRAYSRDLSYAGFLFHLSMLTDALFLLAAFWQFLLLFKADAADVATAFRVSLAVLAVLLLLILNSLPSLVAGSYDTSDSLWAFVGQEFCYYSLVSLGIALCAFLGASAGGGIARRGGKEGRVASLRALLRGDPLNPAVTAAVWRGFLFATFLGGAESWFFFAGQRWAGVFLPLRAEQVNLLASPLPLLLPLAIGVAASLTEEALFRLFGTSFLLERGWGRAAAYGLPALAWAFAHSFEPVFPVYVRGVELLLGGLVFAWVFLRFDLLTAVVGHFLYDVVAYGWPLLVARDPWCRGNGIALLLPALVLAVVGLWRAVSRRPRR